MRHIRYAPHHEEQKKMFVYNSYYIHAFYPFNTWKVIAYISRHNANGINHIINKYLGISSLE